MGWQLTRPATTSPLTPLSAPHMSADSGWSRRDSRHLRRARPYDRGVEPQTASPPNATVATEQRSSLAAGLWLALLGTPPLVIFCGLTAPPDSEAAVWAAELGPSGVAAATGLAMLFSPRWRRFGTGLLIGMPLGFVALALFMAGTLGG